jgi:cytochrome c oxidase subunit 4
MASDSKNPPPASDPAGSVQTTETRETEAEGSELEMAAKPKADEPKRGDAHDAHGHDAHGHDAHGHDAHGDGHDHGLAHTTPVSLLFGILAALLVLTVATVAVTSIDLGAQGNLIVAMIIATVKAGLVVTFFMHLLWDKKFNLILFLTSVLFLILFLSMATTDRGEYQHLVDEYRAQQLAPK